MAAPVSRIMVRQPQSKANAGAFNNGMPMTSSLGCGTWGGNIVSENVHLKHYLNTTWVSVPIKEDKPSDEELFGDVLRPGAGSRSRDDHDLTHGRRDRLDDEPTMTTKTPEELLADASAWWDTAIIDIHPGKIAIRGYPIEELIGHVRFPDMIWLMLRGELPSRGQSDLLEAALVPGVDHGPHAPSIAIARMAVTCGLPVNGAMASAINVLDDIHGGAGQQCMELYREIDAEAGKDGDLVDGADRRSSERQRDAGEKIVPGFGHRFHPVDPRTAPLFALVAKAEAAGVVSGRFAAIGHAVEAAI